MSDKGEYGFMYRTPEAVEWVRQLFEDPTKTLVFHAAKYDLKMFEREGIDIFNMKAKVDCTLIMSKLYNENGQHDLRYLAYRYCNRTTEDKDEINLWLKANRKEFKKQHGRLPNFKDAPKAVIKRRNLWDVESTIILHRFLRKRIYDYCGPLYETERDLMFVCIDMENTGVLVDVTRARELKARAERDVQQILADLRKVCPIVAKRKRKGVKVLETIGADDFNPGSNQQLEGAFNKLGIELKYKTKPKKDKKSGQLKGGGKWAFDEYAMMRYVSKPLMFMMRESGEDGWHADRFYKEVYKAIKKHGLKAREMFPPLVLKYRELSKMVSTYYNHLINDTTDKFIGPDGREYGTLHCKFNQSEAMTGRFSSSEPNLQNMPRILGPRECFVPRKGRRNWHFDYDQVEMKFFVHFAKDKHMAKAIEKDIHLHVAAKIYRVPEEKVTKEQRKRAKGVNFGIIYGAGPPTMAEQLTIKGLPTEVWESRKLVANYHREFPSVRKITNDFKVELHRNGFVTNPHGRRYHIPTKFAYKTLNYMCQGTSADEMKAAMVRIWKWLRKMGLKSKIIKTIHDEIVIEITRAEEWIVPHIIKMMENPKAYFVPITVGVEVNDKRWSKKKDPEELGLKVQKIA